MPPVEEASDDELVAGLIAGEVAAFDAAYTRFGGRIHGYLCRLAGRGRADDLLQETFLRLAGSGRRLRADSNLAAWLYTVATHLSRSAGRRDALDRDGLDAIGHREAARRPDQPDQLAAASQLQRRLEAALAALPAPYREAVVLIAVERLEPAAAAAVTGVRPDAFRQRLARGRAMLEKALAEETTR